MSKHTRSKPLPPLAFGEKGSVVDRTPQAMQDRVAAMTNWVTQQDALKSDEPFEYRSASETLDGLKLSTSASLPTTIKVEDTETTTVASVAAQCGFANFSKFSVFYASTIFGERPSETLKNALK